MTKNKKTHTIIVSDLHLGSKMSRSRALIKLLKSYNFKKLILLGDIFDSLDFTDLTQQQWDFLTYLTKLSRQVKVRWVEGNHDQGLIKITSLLMGIKVYKKYTWEYQGKKYLAVHGHQFDRFIINNTVLSWIISFLYSIAQRLDMKNRRIVNYFKKNNHGWLRLSKKVASSAIFYGKLYRADYVFCGHTHQAMYKYDHKIHYYNAGCWTDIPSSYLIIDENGVCLEYAK
ncbi:MAG: UDP-2,3-diacylglucosamine diphosphatase [Candidatus Moranbacteria bacterium]|nr:UDP-2,3-diacylglucosamine diphosphatase [Candidatus Moranbacteria bacterium]